MKKILIRILGKIFNVFKKAGEYVECENTKKRLASCGENVSIGRGCTIIADHVSVGNNVIIGYGSSLMASIAHIYIGDNVLFGPGVVIRGGGHRYDIIGKTMFEVTDNEKLPENDKDVIIENDVWIGQNAIILKGCRIGEGSIIGAGSVVTRDVPPYTIHVGVHAPMEKARFTEEEIVEHKKKLEQRNA